MKPPEENNIKKVVKFASPSQNEEIEIKSQVAQFTPKEDNEIIQFENEMEFDNEDRDKVDEL